MSIAFQVTAEAGDFDTALANLITITEYLKNNKEFTKENFKRNGVAQPVTVGSVKVGAVSIEDDDQMQGRMRLRRIGEPHAAFERK